MGLEGTYKKSIDGDWLKKHESDEIDYSQDSYDYLFDDDLEYDDINKDSLMDSEGFKKILAESEMSDEESLALWGKDDLGKYTIDTPTPDKKAAQSEDRNMQPISDLDFQKIADEVDREDEKLQEEFKRLAEELEGIF